MNTETEECRKSKTIFDLPDHFIISAISRLDLKQRINCSRYNFIPYKVNPPCLVYEIIYLHFFCKEFVRNGTG